MAKNTKHFQEHNKKTHIFSQPAQLHRRNTDNMGECRATQDNTDILRCSECEAGVFVVFFQIHPPKANTARVSLGCVAEVVLGHSPGGVHFFICFIEELKVMAIPKIGSARSNVAQKDLQNNATQNVSNNNVSKNGNHGALARKQDVYEMGGAVASQKPPAMGAATATASAAFPRPPPELRNDPDYRHMLLTLFKPENFDKVAGEDGVITQEDLATNLPVFAVTDPDLYKACKYLLDNPDVFDMVEFAAALMTDRTGRPTSPPDGRIGRDDINVLFDDAFPLV